MGLRVAFMGTSNFAVPILMALLEKHEVICVYTQIPPLRGDTNKKHWNPIHKIANTANLPIRTPRTWKEVNVQRELEFFNVDVGIVAAYGLILPTEAFTIPRLGCLNVHASLLPRWRGAAPIQKAIIEGDITSGITILQISNGLDTGSILSTIEIPLTDGVNLGSLCETLAHLGANLLLEVLENFSPGFFKTKLQKNQGIIYARKISVDDSRINWTLSATELATMIRGLSPQPGAFCYHNQIRLKILMAISKDRKCIEVPGTILNDSLEVACGTGVLHLVKIQRPGKEALPTKLFLRGYPLRKGIILN